MSSILTNTSAMVALQTLKGINQNLSKTQAEISTGKSVATARDNAAIWAISKVMESDVSGFKGISDSLNLGSSTVAVARSASEKVTELLTEIKGRIVAAQEENVDRGKIQTDIDVLRKEIASIVGAAQFNGLNLLSNTEKTAGSGTVNVLASLDRSSSGVTSSSIGVAKNDLGMGASNISGAALVAASANMTGTSVATATAIAGVVSPAAPGSQGITIGGVEAGFGYSIAITASGGAVPTGFNTTDTNTISYVARDGDTVQDVARGLAEAFNSHVRSVFGDAATTIGATVGGADGNVLTITGATGVAADTFSIAANGYAAAGNTIGGGLAGLATVDVTGENGAANALDQIEGLIQTAIDSAAAFGAVQKRIDIQKDFVGSLVDSLRAGIGSLVDADMEEASARLQALQVQQQLGIQALSIANQAPQNILALFR